MDHIITEKTEAGLWQKLIHEAATVNQLLLPEELESYLVFLLMRFIKQPQLAASILAEEYLHSQQALGEQQQFMLRDVGDKCLLYAGLYPKQAQKRQLKVSYYVRLGCMAYERLEELHRTSFSQLYNRIRKNFVLLMDVLQSTRDFSSNAPTILPLEAYELWNELGSTRALRILQGYVKSFTPQLVNRIDNNY